MFKDDFIWGSATASYQIEGAYDKEGRGLSIWDVFSEQPGRVFDNHTGNVSSDFYHHYKEDIKAMADLGIRAFRMSISWSRILPNGTGVVNEAGIDFYNNVIDELLKNDIEPYVTLFHWDLPYELYKKGHWLNSDISDYFLEYTNLVVERFSDRVSNWMTLNEPQIFIGFGFDTGTHAPGLNLGIRDIMTIVHNVHLSHGKAVASIRENSKLTPFIGVAQMCPVNIPNTDSVADIEAARQAMFKTEFKDNGLNLLTNSLWMDPMFLGEYPEDIIEKYGHYLPSSWQEDLKIIHQPLDFLGVNIYNGRETEMGPNNEPMPSKRSDGYAMTAYDWPVTEKSLYYGPKFYYERYNLPIIITENGLSCRDWIHLDGQVHDPSRIDFLNRYLREMKRAVEDGIDVIGYFQWSLLDNFEWDSGYKHRFGLIYVDYETGKRVIKDSAYWYKKTIEAKGNNL